MATASLPQNLFHEGTASPLSLSTAMSVPPSGDIDIVVDGDASQQGWQPIPSGSKQVVTVGRGTQYESKYLVSTIDSGTLTSTLHVLEADRDYDGTQPTLAPAGTLVEHTISATEMSTINDHMRTKQTHGASGELADTESAQTLKNKTLIDPVGNNGPFVDTTSAQTLSNKTFQTIGLAGARTVPVGAIMMWSAPTVPSGWLVCDGTQFNAATYPLLNTVLGGNTLPNLIDAYVKGGTAPNLTPAGANSTVIVEGNMPLHKHDVAAVAVGDHQHSVSGGTDGQGQHSHGGGYRINYLSDADDGGSGLWMGRSTDQAQYSDAGYHSHNVSGTAAWAGNHTHGISETAKGGTTPFVNEPKHVVLRYIICAAEQAA